MHSGFPEDSYYVVNPSVSPAPVLFEGAYEECAVFLDKHPVDAFLESWMIKKSDAGNDSE